MTEKTYISGFFLKHSYLSLCGRSRRFNKNYFPTISNMRPIPLHSTMQSNMQQINQGTTGQTSSLFDKCTALNNTQDQRLYIPSDSNRTLESLVIQC